jgi:hypothetical protein
MKSTRIRRHDCPWCGAHLTTVVGPDDALPKPGDLTICLHCVGVAQFAQDLSLERPREATIEEVEQILRLFYEEGDGKVH